MNKRLIFTIFTFLFLLLALTFYFLADNKSIKNYPSLGTDIVAFGDSLVEGVGASQGKDFVSLLSKKIGKEIVNLGVSGNTTDDGLKRLSQLDNYKPKVVLLLLGGNDHLKKVPIETTFNNLEKIIKDIQSRGSIVLLLGVRGNLFGDKFKDEFKKLSKKYETAYVEDVLKGLFGNSKYMSDAIHPNDLGYEKITERIYPVLIDLLK
jgi:acyl-CoA thioesterase I